MIHKFILYYIYSHLYVIVYTISNTTLVTAEHITTREILEETTRASPLFYVAASIDASQYRDGYTMQYSLGAGDTTTDPNGNVFHNDREIIVTTLFFFRVFSVNSTQEVCVLVKCVQLIAVMYSDFYREKFQLQQACRH